MINRIQKLFLLILIAGTMTACQQPLQQQTGAPSWADNVVWYQIFVERFHNGDTTNDPTPEDIAVATQIFPVPSDWKITSWTSDRWKMDPWAEDLGISFRNALQHRRYGGDFEGVINKLD